IVAPQRPKLEPCLGENRPPRQHARKNDPVGLVCRVDVADQVVFDRFPVSLDRLLHAGGVRDAVEVELVQHFRVLVEREPLLVLLLVLLAPPGKPHARFTPFPFTRTRSTALPVESPHTATRHTARESPPPAA